MVLKRLLKDLFFVIKSETGLYIIFGLATTVVSYISYIIFAKIFRYNYMISSIISWVIAVIFAFFANKKYVFNSKTIGFNAIFRELISFFAVRVFSLGLDLASMFVIIDVMGVYDLIAKIISNIVVAASNYIASKFFIFKKKNA